MAQSKTYLFNLQLQELSRLSRILSHPARIQIIEAVRRNRAVSFGQLKRLIPLGDSTLSRHLAVLKREQIILLTSFQTEKSGYCLNKLALEELLSRFSGFVDGEYIGREGILRE